MYVCRVHAQYLGRWGRVLDPLELEVRIVVSSRVGAENAARAATAEPFLSPAPSLPSRVWGLGGGVDGQTPSPEVSSYCLLLTQMLT